ncbi:hypothetical protein [Acidisphaera sp. S103]|uniref:hypothetical protein n=1 Tax=Acidisphaera sp. S103 TaxID=1747223 RepID=UPI00131E4086|nr:hypothetical protein [Acidisphaera sp. S103]
MANLALLSVDGNFSSHRTIRPKPLFSEGSEQAFPKRWCARRQGHHVAQLNGHNGTLSVILLHNPIVNPPPHHRRGVDIAPDLRDFGGTIVARTEVPAGHGLDIVHENSTKVEFATQYRGHLIQGLTISTTGRSEPTNEKRSNPEQDQNHEADG